MEAGLAIRLVAASLRVPIHLAGVSNTLFCWLWLERVYAVQREFLEKIRSVEEDLCSCLWSVGNGRGAPILPLEFLKVLRLLLEIRSVT